MADNTSGGTGVPEVDEIIKNLAADGFQVPMIPTISQKSEDIQPSTPMIDKLKALHDSIPSKPASEKEIKVEDTPLGDMLSGVLKLSTQGLTDYTHDMAWAATGGKGIAPSDARKLNEIKQRYTK